MVLNFVSQTDPIRVRFAIDERRYLRFARQLRDVTHEGVPAGVGLELILADGVLHEYVGNIVGTGAAVNPTTGTFTLEADFPNPDNIVVAGQFARVRAVVETRRDALLIPQRCVSELQGNFRVFAVTRNGRVELREVQPGPTIGRLQIIESGLEAGERVALDAALLKDGMKVVGSVAELDDAGAAQDTSDQTGA